jgi:hypothetical protein
MNAPQRILPNRLPDPWLFDTQHLLCELARIRELALQIPAFRNDIIARVNTVIDAVWNLEQTLRFLLRLHSDAQRAFRQQHDKSFPKRQTKPIHRQTAAQPGKARRRASHRVA